MVLCCTCAEHRGSNGLKNEKETTPGDDAHRWREGAATLQNAEIALVPFYILQFVLELPGNVPNAPQRTGRPVLIEKIRFLRREVAFHPTDTSPMRRTLYKSIGPSAHVRSI